MYRRGDIFVSPSYAEGFPTTILEAMATGLPVVSTDVVGVRDCIRPDDNGVLVPPDDPFALAAGIRRLITDDVLRRRWPSVRTATSGCAGPGRWSRSRSSRSTTRRVRPACRRSPDPVIDAAARSAAGLSVSAQPGTTPLSTHGRRPDVIALPL